MAAEGSTVQVWDLRAVRARLADLGLDWDAPPYPPVPAPAPGRAPPVEPLAVEVVGGR